jgi:hypothetical protein
MVGLCSTFKPNSNYCQAFKLDDVKPLKPNTDFSNVKVNGVSWVNGRDQEVQVQWKGSNVTVIEKDSEGNETFTVLPDEKLNGSLKIGLGISLYITGGQIKEG